MNANARLTNRIALWRTCGKLWARKGGARSCPYNYPAAREAWFAGFDAAVTEMFNA